MNKQITFLLSFLFISSSFCDTIKYKERKASDDFEIIVVTDVEFLGVSRKGLHYQKSTFFGNVLKTIPCANVDEILDSNNIIINYSCLEFTYVPKAFYQEENVELTEVSTIDDVSSSIDDVSSSIIQILPSSSKIKNMSEQEKLLLYEEHKINPYYNALISGLLPTYGHYRVNKWKRGLIILSLNALALLFNDADLDPSGPAPDGVTESEAKKYAQVFALILLGDTYYQTSIYNKNLSKSIFGQKKTLLSPRLPLIKYTHYFNIFGMPNHKIGLGISGYSLTKRTINNNEYYVGIGTMIMNLSLTAGWKKYFLNSGEDDYYLATSLVKSIQTISDKEDETEKGLLNFTAVNFSVGYEKRFSSRYYLNMEIFTLGGNMPNSEGVRDGFRFLIYPTLHLNYRI